MACVFFSAPLHRDGGRAVGTGRTRSSARLVPEETRLAKQLQRRTSVSTSLDTNDGVPAHDTPLSNRYCLLAGFVAIYTRWYCFTLAVVWRAHSQQLCHIHSNWLRTCGLERQPRLNIVLLCMGRHRDSCPNASL
jgi:hypothetical protein